MHKTKVIIRGDSCPILYWIASSKNEDYVGNMADSIAALSGSTSFILSTILVESWDDDLTPWRAKKPFKGGEYSGSGLRTLDELRSVMAEFEKGRAVTKRFIGGYSLAGLFSLWAFYESGCFDGAASCSGSLWYPGWVDYAKRTVPPEGSIVYLSLGDREEYTKNQVMAQVGSCIQNQYELLMHDKNIAHCTYELNSGGHFKDPEERMAKGFSWFLTHA